MFHKRAFTLIEMIVTLTLIAGVMVALSMHIVNLSKIWLDGTGEDFFEQHVDGVMLFLNNAFVESESTKGKGSEAAPELPVEWARPPGWSDLDDPLLYFRQKEAPALFVREGQNLPKVHAYLYWDDREGLSILWYSELDELDLDDVNDLRRTPVSPYVTEIEYAYYDREEEEWTITAEPEEEDNNEFILPHAIKLTFEREDENFVRSLYLPQRSFELPLF